MTREEYIKKLFSLFELVNVLSEKNGGKVLRLRHKILKKDMILRSYPQSFDAYRLLSGVLCENLPEIYDAVECEDGQLILEEYIDGITVAQVMESGKYRYRGAKIVLQRVCHALSVLHENGVVHRDVKPENVMIEKSGRVVLIDFNASRMESNASKDTVIMGTVGYASPEQLGLLQTDARTDVYAAGVLYNVMLTGQHPSATMAPGKAGVIVRKCTAVNPKERYQTAAELWSALY